MQHTQHPLICARDISYRYGKKFILQNISLEIYSGEICILRGPSGSGKSSLISLIAGDRTPSTGSLSYFSEDHHIMTTDAEFTVFYRENIGTFFTESLFFEKNTVRENILFPSIFGGYFFDGDFFQMLIERFEIVSLLESPVSDISSGERERVALIRMFVSRPTILFLDEPFSHLDDRLFQIGIDILRQYIDTYHPTVCIISHNPAVTFDGARHLHLQNSTLTVSSC